MLGIEIVCSDEACAKTSEVVVTSLDAVEALACEACGCAAQPLAVWDVVEIQPRPPAIEHLPLAA